MKSKVVSILQSLHMKEKILEIIHIYIFVCMHITSRTEFRKHIKFQNGKLNMLIIDSAYFSLFLQLDIN